jgi:hypothetical protein
MLWKFTLDNATLGTLRIPEPLGWSATPFTLQRREGWHGFVNEIAPSLEFYNGHYVDDLGEMQAVDAFDYLKQAYDTQGIEAVITLTVEGRCKPSDSWEVVFMCSLNFSSLEITNKCTLKCLLERNDGPELLLSRLDSVVDLLGDKTVDGAARATALTERYADIAGQPIRKISKGEWNEAPPGGDPLDPPDDPTIGGNKFRLTTLVPNGSSDFDQEIWITYDIPIVDVIQEEAESFTGSGVFDWHNFSTDAPNELFLCVEGGEYSIAIANFQAYAEMQCGPEPGNGFTVHALSIGLFLRMGSNPEILLDAETRVDGGHTLNGVLTGNYSGSATLAAGDGIKLYLRFYYSVTWETSFFFDRHAFYNIVDLDVQPVTFGKGTINVSLISQASASRARLQLVYDAFNTLTEAISENRLNVLSDYFGRTDALPNAAAADGAAAFTALLAGLHLRGFSGPLPTSDFPTYSPTLRTPDKPLPASLKDLFASLQAVYGIGMGIELVGGTPFLRVEPIRYFYDHTTVVLHLHNVERYSSNFVRKVDQKAYFATAEIGYQDWKAEEYSGLDEMCTKANFVTDLKKLRQELSQVAEYIGSSYLIEVGRRLGYADFATQDWLHDNKTFLLRLDRASAHALAGLGIGYTPELAIDIGTSANILAPDKRMNAAITVQRNARRWRWALQMGNRLSFATSKAAWASGEGNFTAAFQTTSLPQYDVYGLIVPHDPIGNEAENGDLLPNGEGFLAWRYPEVVSLKYPVSVADYRALRAYPIGLIRVDFGDPLVYEDFFLQSVQFPPDAPYAQFELIPFRSEFA